ncbi:CLUMA_CG002057, isoform A [Clunio marinus]|uniref:CLUMA_CG002057, isoform A n=1 Tax=Clunio marinus TaxID=568069 RepID=A0A1J1HJS8_9DIPT|nr:CLUMA_CG002057, isoform A [Clunio marinus]
MLRYRVLFRDVDKSAFNVVKCKYSSEKETKYVPAVAEAEKKLKFIMNFFYSNYFTVLTLGPDSCQVNMT